MRITLERNLDLRVAVASVDDSKRISTIHNEADFDGAFCFQNKSDPCQF
jgi:hypothetical protein